MVKKKKKAGKKIYKETAIPKDSLTAKQRRFVEEYCVDFNATQAAIRAGYSETTASEIGWENLRKPQIKSKIEIRMSALTMSSDEGLLRMSDFARGSFTPFLVVDENNNVTVDLTSLPAQAKMHLIKKIKQTKRTFGIPGMETTEVVTEIEIHDSKDATKTILQMHGKLVDKKTIDHLNGGEKFETPTTIIFGKGSNGDSNQ